MESFRNFQKKYTLYSEQNFQDIICTYYDCSNFVRVYIGVLDVLCLTYSICNWCHHDVCSGTAISV